MYRLMSHKLSWIVLLLIVQFALSCKNSQSPAPAAAPVAGPTVGSGPQATPEEELPQIDGLPKPTTSPLPQSSDGNPAPSPMPQTPSASLPADFIKAIDGCKSQGRYYDLALASCTTTPLADFSCDLTVLLSEGSAVLNPTQKGKLKEYVDLNLTGYSLYACTLDAGNPKLHFYRVEADRIRAHNVTMTP